MWAYIYYSIYLDSMDTNDHNAVQKYVYEMVSWAYNYIELRIIIELW